MFDMHSRVNAGLTMVKSNTDLPYMNEVLIAHRATNLVYRMGPARKAQMIVPTTILPGPQSAVIQTIRPTISRSNACSNLRAAYQRFENADHAADSTATGAKDAEKGDTGMQTSNHIEHQEKRYLQSQVRASHQNDRPRERDPCAADFDDSNNEDSLCENDHGNDITPILIRTHRALCAADFEDSEDGYSSCDDGDILGFNLSAYTLCNKELQMRQERELTTIQLRIQEKVLRGIAQQALKARRNGKGDSGIFSKEAPDDEDRVLETILALIEMGQAMNDAGTFQGELEEEECRDIQMMVRNTVHTLMQKATHPFRPSGVRVVQAKLSQCLEAFGQMRLKLLQEKVGTAMAEILKEKRLDLEPR